MPYTHASPCKVTKADGSVRIEKPLSPLEHRAVLAGAQKAKVKEWAAIEAKNLKKEARGQHRRQKRPKP